MSGSATVGRRTGRARGGVGDGRHETVPGTGRRDGDVVGDGRRAEGRTRVETKRGVVLDRRDGVLDSRNGE